MTDEPSDSPRVSWRDRLQRARSFVRATAPFAAGVLAMLAGLLLYNILSPAPRPLTADEVSTSVAYALASATPAPAFSARIYEVIRPSLVLIQKKSLDKDGKEQDSLGSGVVVNDQGDILTSLHVVVDATELTITFADGTKSGAEVVVEQPENDIAVIRATQPPALIVPAVLGGLGGMRIGDEAYAVGNPFGLYGSMSAGVISGFERSFHPTNGTRDLHGLIQIDTAVNPGNSGGPLLNRDGQVIGIVTGLANPTGETFFIGIGFAMPIETALSAFGGSPID